MQKYKLIIHNKKIYREYILDAEIKKHVTIGTKKECDLRLNKNMFFEEFMMNVVKVGGEWQISSGSNMYFTADGVMKFEEKELNHGDTLTFKYKSSNSEALKIDFFMDFDSVEIEYNRLIDISDKTQITIGGMENNDIFIVDELLGKDSVTLNKENDYYLIKDNRCKYGVYVNGIKINDKSKLQDYDFFGIVGYHFYYKSGKLYTTESNNIKIRNLNYIELKEEESKLKYPKFNRSTRRKYKLPQKDIELLYPKAKPNRFQTNLILLIAPTFSMLVLTIVLRGIVGGGGMFVLYSAMSMGITLLSTIAGYMFKKKNYNHEIKERERKYLEYIEKKEIEIAELRKSEEEVLGNIFRTMDENIDSVRRFDKNLFDRDSKDEDFLFSRIGTGSIEAINKVKYQNIGFKDTEDELMDYPQMLEMKYKNIINGPVISRISKANAIGIVGNNQKLLDFSKNMIVDIAVRHFFKDVKMIFILKEKDIEKFQWIRWLKHVENEEINVRNLVYDEESAKIILEYVYSVLSQRERELQDKQKISCLPYFVIFVYDRSIIRTHPISKYINDACKYGFTFIFMEEYEELLPNGCDEIILLSGNKSTGEIFLAENSNNKISFEYETISDTIAEEISLRLTPVNVEEVNLENDLTKNISLFELLDIMNTDDLDLDERWSKSSVDKSMAAPIGVKLKNEVVSLDLNEKHHGPHGLVAGTTGSGKSEILQSYILSMAATFHPYEVGFVIIDFKGGGMVNQFKNLPHLIGTITNIDGREIQRSLMSIKAELRKRQELFAANSVNHIDAYINLYKKDKSLIPLPHLIIVVDEFAELKTEHPDFMKELISAARIGRSLGVHLILATQKPSGVVDSQIWSNSKFKLCLKVQTKEDSNEVLKTPLAAEIIEPGRAYLQVGNNEQFDLFQSAYSGAKVSDADKLNDNEFEINEVNLWGKKKMIFSNKHKDNDQSSITQLESMVEYINDYCIKNKISKLQGICLPPLKDILYLDDINEIPHQINEGIFVTLGIYDDPEQQIQGELSMNLSENNTYIVGSSQSGKTILLQTMMKELVSKYTSEEVNVYIIDCGNMALKVFEDAKIVGGVATITEEEKIINLFKMLNNEIALRKNIFVKNMVGTYSAYLEAGYKNMPQIFLMIDNITAFREYYPGFDNDILVLSREGQSVGINIICSATQTNAITYKALSNFGTRIALNCNDKNEYSNIFDRCRMEPKEVPGRGLVMIEKRILEFQCALPVRGMKEVERFESLKLFVNEINASRSSKKAKPIPQVPKIIKGNDFYNENKEEFNTKYKIPVGINYDTVEIKHFDLLKNELFAIAGKEKSGKTNFVTNLITNIQRTIINNITEAYIVDSSERQLEKVADYGCVKKYTIDSNDIEEILEDILDELEDRKEYVNENRGIKSDEELLNKFPLKLVIIENRGAINELISNKELYDVFNKIIKEFKNYKVSIIFSNIDNAVVPFNAPDIIKQLKANRKIVIFDDMSEIKFLDSNPKLQKIYSKPISIGDGYFFNGSEVEKVKTILDA